MRPAPCDRPADEDAVPDDLVPSRLATVLPVLRGVVLAAVVGLTILVVLARLGVDIGPLLAGFGIVGLAFSFGSQTLVRDIVSGVFFMIEDAFRVGEYVDTAGSRGRWRRFRCARCSFATRAGRSTPCPSARSPRSPMPAATGRRSSSTSARPFGRSRAGPQGHQEDRAGPAGGPRVRAAFHRAAEDAGRRGHHRQRRGHPAEIHRQAEPGLALQREALKRVYRALNEARVPFASNAVTVRGGEGPLQSQGAAAITAVPPPTPARTDRGLSAPRAGERRSRMRRGRPAGVASPEHEVGPGFPGKASQPPAPYAGCRIGAACHSFR